MLDVGTGTGDIAARAREAGRRRGIALTVIGLDLSPSLARAARQRGTPAVCGDALSLPFGDRSIDIAVCSQLLHHFRDDDAVRLLRELDRVARRRVIVCDLRRSWLAAGGFWLLSWPLRFHAVTRHDGVVSVLRGFSGPELTRLGRAAIGQAPRIRHRRCFRLVASWEPARSLTPRDPAYAADCGGHRRRSI